jgi:hypothetical protein
MYKKKKKQEASRKPQKQPALGIAGVGACKAHAVFRSSPVADDIQNHRSPPTTAEHEKLWPSGAGSGRKLPSACWPLAEQEEPPWPWLDTTRLKEAGDYHGRAHVKRKPIEDHRSNSKDNPKFCTARPPSPETHHGRPTLNQLLV